MEVRKIIDAEKPGSAIAIGGLLLVAAMGIGLGMGFMRRGMANNSAQVIEGEQLKRMSAIVTSARISRGSFSVEIPPETWAGMTEEARLASATDLTYKFLDNYHVAAGVIFSGDHAVVEVTQANARLIE